MQNSVRVPVAMMTLAVIPIPTILIPNPRKDRLTPRRIIPTRLVARAALAAVCLPRFYNYQFKTNFKYIYIYMCHSPV